MNQRVTEIIEQLTQEIADLQDLIKVLHTAFGDVPRGTKPKREYTRRGKAGEDRPPAAPKAAV